MQFALVLLVPLLIVDTCTHDAFPDGAELLHAQETSILSDFLKDNGIKADYYHAGQGAGERKSVQSSWQKGEISVVCATIAYGMGIDKPNVR